MKEFWSGFEKRAKAERPQSIVAPSLAAGAGVTAAGATIQSVRQIMRDVSEDKAVKRSRSIKDVKKLLQPGDILISNNDPKLRKVWYVKGKKSPVQPYDFIRAVTGGPHYHTSIYTGKGRVTESYGEGIRAGTSPVEHALQGNEVKIYRPNVSTKELNKAVESAKNFRGSPYPKEKDVLVRGLKSLAGVGDKATYCTTGPKQSRVCTEIVPTSYPEQFSKTTVMPQDIRSHKNMKLVARYGNVPMTLKEKAISRVIHPALKNLKWGLGATALTAAALKGKEIMDRRIAKNKDLRGSQRSLF